MRRILLLSFLLFSFTFINAQTVEELKAEKASIAAEYADAKAKADALQGQVNDLNDRIKKLSGWLTGFSGLAGFNLTNSDNWVGNNPNTDAVSTALSIGLTAFANKQDDKSFWNNKGILTRAWQDIDLDNEAGDDDLFDNGTVDILNVSSLYGYKITKNLAASALGELNTSTGNFFAPGTIDIGAGATWTPTPALTVVVHPLNYRLAFSGFDGVENSGALGAKFRADYTRKLRIAGKSIAWSSTLTSFLPYSDDKMTISPGGDEPDYEAGLFEYTWLNSLSLDLIKGIGLGVNFGIRDAAFESNDSQNFYSIGLSYAL